MADAATQPGPQDRHSRLEQARLATEWDEVQGPLGGVIQHLRRRARSARRTAWLFLVLLFLTVVTGLGYYLLLPFWQSYVDGRRSTLQATLRTIEAENVKLDEARGEVVAREGDGLAALLETTFESVPSGTAVELYGHVILGDAVLLYGRNGTLLRSSDGGQSFVPVSSDTGAWLYGHVTLGDTLLLHGESGTLLRSMDGGQSFVPVPSNTEAGLFGHVTLGDALLLYGDAGTLLRSSDGGQSFAPVPSDIEAGLGDHDALGQHVTLGDALLLYGAFGTILRSSDGGQSFVRVPSDTEAGLLGHVTLGDALLLYGAFGAIVRSSDGGQSFLPVPSDTEAGLRGHVTLGDALLLYGESGTILRSVDGGQSFLPVPSDTEAGLRGHVTLGDALLLYGNAGTILRSVDGGQSFATIPSGTEASLYGEITLGDALLLHGESGTILRLADGGQSFVPVPSGTEAGLVGHVTLGETLLFYGGDASLFGGRGAIVRSTSRWQNATRDLKLAAGQPGDDTLIRFLGETLPQYLRDWPPVANIQDELIAITTRRAAFAILQEQTDDQLGQLEKFPYAYRQEENALEFSSFLSLCRGTATPDATVTEKCLSAWQSEQTRGESWWKAVSEQVPAGIILMFLLATLGSLYRYNLRLAGFHDARADALRLMGYGRDEAALRDLLATTPGDAVNLATIFLAADKVEMGVIKAKLAQAEIEIAKTLNKTE